MIKIFENHRYISHNHRYFTFEDIHILISKPSRISSVYVHTSRFLQEIMWPSPKNNGPTLTTIAVHAPTALQSNYPSGWNQGTSETSRSRNRGTFVRKATLRLCPWRVITSTAVSDSDWQKVNSIRGPCIISKWEWQRADVP